MPLIDRNLAGDNGGRATVGIIEDLQKVESLGRVEHRQAPIVEHEELHAADGFEQAAVAAVAAGERERSKARAAIRAAAPKFSAKYRS